MDPQNKGYLEQRNRFIVVVPEEVLNELDDEQLQAILIHETAHLARRDQWVCLAQRMAVLLFWSALSENMRPWAA
jgi:beta-lactamase regulating signal transducer with metallopeptidase domain